MTGDAIASETFILFTVAGTTYALRSRDVRAHRDDRDVTRVPNAAPFVDGVVFSRGQVVPAVNLRARFGFERAPYDLRTRLLVVQAAGAASAWSSTRRASSCRSTTDVDPAAARALAGLSGRYSKASRQHRRSADSRAESRTQC